MTQRWSVEAPVRSGRARSVLIVAYGVYLTSVALLVWSPDPAGPSAAVARTVAGLARLGVGVSGGLVEFGLNVVMLIPLSLLGGLLVRRLRVSDWIAAGFCLSLTVEVIQRLVLPTRSGSSRDIVANTLGAAIGAMLLVVGPAVLRSVRESRAAASTDEAAHEPTQ